MRAPYEALGWVGLVGISLAVVIIRAGVPDWAFILLWLAILIWIELLRREATWYTVRRNGDFEVSCPLCRWRSPKYSFGSGMKPSFELVHLAAEAEFQEHVHDFHPGMNARLGKVKWRSG